VHKNTQQKVAVKIIKKLNMTEKQIERTRYEIETLKICQHSNIMRLYDIFENSDYIYLVLEYLSGGNLLQYLNEKHYKIYEMTACRYIYSIVNALHYMHSIGIIHRDIKPENIVLETPSDKSDLKIVDFGLSKIFSPGEYSTDSVGTLIYAPPEILLGKRYNNKVDIWSLGILAYFLLAGSLPFNDSKGDKATALY